MPHLKPALKAAFDEKQCNGGAVKARFELKSSEGGPVNFKKCQPEGANATVG